MQEEQDGEHSLAWRVDTRRRGRTSAVSVGAGGSALALVFTFLGFSDLGRGAFGAPPAFLPASFTIVQTKSKCAAAFASLKTTLGIFLFHPPSPPFLGSTRSFDDSEMVN